jgi:Mg-chelatase subunit ChlD
MNTESNTAILSEFDFIVVIDKSGSMGETDMAGGRSRWDYVQETAVAICRDIAAIDSDGLGLVLFSSTSIVKEDGVGVDKIKEVFSRNRPGGSTPLAEALEAAFNLAGKSEKKDFIIVFTDGVPDDKARAADVIKKQAAKQAADDDCTVLFVQVGYDAGASAYLKSLDDDLTGAKFDIVDCKTMKEAEMFTSVTDLILAAIND